MRNRGRIELLDILGDKLDELCNVLESLEDEQAWPFLTCTRSDEGDHHFQFQLLTDIVQGFEVNTIWEKIPRLVGKERIFLHAFSGRRRPGDLQHYIEATFARDSEGILLHVVSMDVVIDQQWGDARSEETRQFWLRGARQGLVHGGLCDRPAKPGAKPGMCSLRPAQDMLHDQYALWKNYGAFRPWRFEKQYRSMLATSYSSLRSSSLSASQVPLGGAYWRILVCRLIRRSLPFGDFLCWP